MYFLNLRPPSAEPHQNLLRHLPETLFRFRAATRAPARLRERLGPYSCRHTCSSTAEGTFGALFVPRHVLQPITSPEGMVTAPE